MNQPVTPAEMIAAAVDWLRAKAPRAPSAAASAATSAEAPASLPRHVSAPQGYAETYPDVARARALALIADPDLHYTLYGRQQGRHILSRITHDIQRVIVISPSHLKQCGIGEWGRYLSEQLALQVAQVDVVRTSSAALAMGAQALEGTLVVVNHGPGLFDGLNPRLSQGESTTRLLQNLDRMAQEFGALPLIVHHSLLDTDHDLLFSRQSMIMNSDIPSVTFISSAGRHFFIPHLELGVSPVPVPKHRYRGDRDERPEVVGFFGFFQYGGKDFDSLFHLLRELRGRLVGSVATGNADELARFEETLEELRLPHDLGTGWVSDTELLARLKDADYFYLPQNDYDHWNNSATARFVTNLDRPLFLPPHHPFLDMEDGSIFASKEDLPRVVAHFREPGHFAQAVARVQAFRARASMANTVSEMRGMLSQRIGEVARGLMETPPVCSAERMLELPEQARAGFAAALGADPARPDSFAAPWRAPEGRQFWRKHYELGDLVHSTLLESVNAIYLAVTKRQIHLEELLALLGEDIPQGWPMGKTLAAAFAQAMSDKAMTFHDPEIVLLDGGVEVDWRSLMTPERIETFWREKTARRAAITAQIDAAQIDAARTGAGRNMGPQPPVTNVVDLLLIPAAVLAQRAAPFDLGPLNLTQVQQARTPAGRFNRLLAAANAAGVALTDHLVFDQPTPPAIAPHVHTYVLEDFAPYNGDMFLLNAIRQIDKRDPYAIEMVVLTGLLNTIGQRAVLTHLLTRAEGRIAILGLEDMTRDLEAETQVAQNFLMAARDPLAGLIEARNAYEVTRRNNARWWLSNKTICDRLWATAGKPELLNLIYAWACQTPRERAAPQSRRDNPIWQMDRQGHFLPPLRNLRQGLALLPGHALQIKAEMSGALALAGAGFHPPEDIGVWASSAEARLLLQIDTALPAGARLTVELGAFGSARMSRPRQLTLGLRPVEGADQTLLEDDSAGFMRVRHDLTGDAIAPYALDIDRALAPGVYVLQLSLDRATSPAELGLSDDQRQLGVLLHRLALDPTGTTDAGH